MDQFRRGDIRVILATDVLARGIDVPDVSLVVNHDMPAKIEPYSHRIGRTGRAGRDGRAVTFLTDADAEVMYDLKNYLESTNSVVPSQLAKHPAAQAPLNARADDGKLLNQRRRDTVIFTG